MDKKSHNTIRKLDLNLLAVFEAVYITGSVKKAALMLNSSSPNVSQSLQKLKDYFGDPLFLRDGQKLCVTAMATRLHKKVNENYAGLCSSLGEFMQETYREKIFIQSSPYLSLRIVPLITSFYKNEGVECVIVHKHNENMSDSTEDSLSLRQVDLVFGYNNHLGLSTKSLKIGSDKLTFICRKDHPRLVGSISQQEAMVEKFTYLNSDEISAQVERDKLASNLSERIFSLKSTSFFTMAAHIECTDSIGIVPLWFYEKFKHSFNIINLKTDIYSSDVDFYMSYSNSNVDRSSFVKLHEYIKENIALK